MKDSVSSKQLIALTFIVGLGLNILNLPALTVMAGGRDGWFTMLLIGAADCLLLYCTLFVMDKMKRSRRAMGAAKVFSAVFSVLFALWAAVKLILILGEIRLFFGKIVFENLDWLVFLVLPLALVGVLGASTCRGMGRLSELALPLGVITVAVLLFTAYAGDVKLSDILPILYKNTDALTSPLKLMLWTGNYPVLFCLFKKVDFKKHTKLLCTGAAAVCAAVAVAFTLALSAAYGSVSFLIDYGSNASNMTQYVGSYNFGRIDLIVYAVWSVVLLVEAGLFQMAAVRAIGWTAGRQMPRLYSAAIAVSMYALLSFLFPTSNALFDFATGFASLVTGVLQVLAPLTAALVCLFVKMPTGRGGALYDEK